MLVNLAVSKKCEYSGMSTRKAMSLVMCKTRKNWPNISAARERGKCFMHATASAVLRSLALLSSGKTEHAGGREM